MEDPILKRSSRPDFLRVSDTFIIAVFLSQISLEKNLTIHRFIGIESSLACGDSVEACNGFSFPQYPGKTFFVATVVPVFQAKVWIPIKHGPYDSYQYLKDIILSKYAAYSSLQDIAVFSLQDILFFPNLSRTLSHSIILFELPWTFYQWQAIFFSNQIVNYAAVGFCLCSFCSLLFWPHRLPDGEISVHFGFSGTYTA